MKKLVFAVICCFSLSLGTMMAQDQNGRQGRRGRQMRDFAIQLADTSITNHMELTPEQFEQIDALNKNYSETLKEKMGAPGESGKRPSREEREARMQEMKTLRQQGNKKLREVLGTEAYIEYLEKALERAAAMPGMRGPGGQGQRRGNGGFEGAPGGFEGGPQGGFGGPGGGFGGEF